MATDEAKKILFQKPLPRISELMTIVRIVADRQRNVPRSRGVLPVTVQAYLNCYRHEQTLRRDMSLLAKAGYLERVGFDDATGVATRRGYRVVDDGG